MPLYVTQKWFDIYPEETLELPPMLRQDRDDTPRFSWYLHWKLPEPRLRFLEEADEWKNIVRCYLACTSFVDSQVGRILDALEANGLAENTIVVLWSDHGLPPRARSSSPGRTRCGSARPGSRSSSPGPG